MRDWEKLLSTNYPKFLCQIVTPSLPEQRTWAIISCLRSLRISIQAQQNSASNSMSPQSTDFSNMSQLVFAGYMKETVVKEDSFLFCKALPITTKAVDVKKLVNNFFRDHNLSWEMVSAICSDGAPAMLGRNSGFGALLKADASHIKVTHCVLHRHTLATETLPPILAEVLKIVVESVNYVRNSARSEAQHLQRVV